MSLDKDLAAIKEELNEETRQKPRRRKSNMGIDYFKLKINSLR